MHKSTHVCTHMHILQRAVFVPVFSWDPPAWLAWPGFLPALADTSPRQRIQNLSRFVWKQATVASELWEKLTARCVDQHRHIERTLEQLLEIQGAMEELSTTLTQAEGVRATWEPIGDLFIDSLPDHIQTLKVCRSPHLATVHPETWNSSQTLTMFLLMRLRCWPILQLCLSVYVLNSWAGFARVASVILLSSLSLVFSESRKGRG